MARINPSTHSESGVITPASSAEEVVAANTDLGTVTRSVYVGVTGDLEVMMLDDQVVTFRFVPAGSVLPIRVKQIRANSTADSIVAIF